MKRFCLFIAILATASAVWGSKLYLAADSIYYFPYFDGTASVSGARVQAKELNIQTRIMIPDSCLTSDAADPAHMSEYLVTIIGEGAFLTNNEYTKVVLPDSLKRIDKQAFYSCSKMVIDKWPEKIELIDTLAFFNCNQLTEVNLPNIKKLGQQVFSRCTRLESITFGDLLDSLPKNTFSADTKLQQITFGSGLKDIASNAMSRCYDLTTITCFAATPPTVDSKTFQNTSVGNITLNVPCASLDAYKAADMWKNMGAILPFAAFSFSAVAADESGFINIIHQPTDCNENFAEIEAVANIDYVFDHWSDKTTDAHYTLTLTQDTALVAYFKAVEKDTIDSETDYCENDFPYYWTDGKQYVPGAGVYTYNEPGAPSVLRLTINSLPVNQVDDLDTTLCAGETLTWRGKTYFDSGDYFDTLVNQYGCDSILALHLTIRPENKTSFERTICEGESLSVFSDTTIMTEGTFTRIYEDQNGCDSIVTLTVAFNEPYKLTTSIECFLGTQHVGDIYGSVEIVRSGLCDNTVTLTPIVTNDYYHFSHWRLGMEDDAPALADNPLVIDLDKDLHIRVIIYDNGRTDLEQSTISNQQCAIYDIQGRLLRYGEGVTTDGLQKGLYIIKTADRVEKINVK